MRVSKHSLRNGSGKGRNVVFPHPSPPSPNREEENKELNRNNVVQTVETPTEERKRQESAIYMVDCTSATRKQENTPFPLLAHQSRNHTNKK